MDPFLDSPFWHVVVKLLDWTNATAKEGTSNNFSRRNEVPQVQAVKNFSFRVETATTSLRTFADRVFNRDRPT